MYTAIENNLRRGIKLLNNLSNQQYRDASFPPYYSSIGVHIRHILDVFSCIFNGMEAKTIDFSNRNRDEQVELYTEKGIEYFNKIIAQLNQLETEDLDKTVCVIDDLGAGKISANYTVGAALMQAHSHAIHHYASIGFIINGLSVELPDADFGYNPTTPKKQQLN